MGFDVSQRAEIFREYPKRAFLHRKISLGRETQSITISFEFPSAIYVRNKKDYDDFRVNIDTHGVLHLAQRNLAADMTGVVCVTFSSWVVCYTVMWRTCLSVGPACF